MQTKPYLQEELAIVERELDFTAWLMRREVPSTQLKSFSKERLELLKRRAFLVSMLKKVGRA
jgi:hypothetical protein